MKEVNIWKSSRSNWSVRATGVVAGQVVVHSWTGLDRGYG